MKIYLVGGAVRDSLMGLKPKDLDYVVVDSSIKEMLSLGYEKVGIDFPVFLHPKTKDEYALARIERSIGNRYEDFITETNNVSLNEDLIRRDLTINAIAFKDGLYYDPFNGMNDLKNKILRHTSNAFKEDPVRILRIARFLARYPDFNVAKETKKLIIEMINNNMINSLVPKRIWKELSRALTEKKPSKFFKFLNEVGFFTKNLKILNQTKKNWNNLDNNNNNLLYLQFNLLINGISNDDLLKLNKNLGSIDKDIMKLGNLYSNNIYDNLKNFNNLNNIELINLYKLLNRNKYMIDKIYNITKFLYKNKKIIEKKELLSFLEKLTITTVPKFILKYQKINNINPTNKEIQNYIYKKQLNFLKNKNFKLKEVKNENINFFN